MNYKSSTWWAVNLQVSKVEFQLGDSQKGFTAICGAFEILLSNLSHFELRILQDPGWFPRTSDFLGALVVDSSTRYTMGSKTWLLWSFCTKVLHAMIYSYFQSQIRKLHRIPGPSIFQVRRDVSFRDKIYLLRDIRGFKLQRLQVFLWHPIFFPFGKFSHHNQRREKFPPETFRFNLWGMVDWFHSFQPTLCCTLESPPKLFHKPTTGAICLNIA